MLLVLLDFEYENLPCIRKVFYLHSFLRFFGRHMKQQNRWLLKDSFSLHDRAATGSVPIAIGTTAFSAEKAEKS
jgi:hypothetical protein